jgi:hypothetical protein
MKPVPDHPGRDPELSAAWREHSTEMPSAAADAAVLAAAHRAVGSAPRDAGKPVAEATSPQRWWMPLAAAATIGAVALGILQTMQQESPVSAPTVSDMPARSTERTISSPPAPADQLAATERKDAPRAAAESAAPAMAPAITPMRPAAKVVAPHASDNVAPSPASIAAAPQPFPAEKKSESAESADIKDRARAAPTPAAAAAVAQTSEPARAELRRQNETAASAPAASGAVTMAKTLARADASSAPAADIDAWIARIRKLHNDGKLADAAKELIAFRAAVPDADGRLPPELRAWAATVKP